MKKSFTAFSLNVSLMVGKYIKETFPEVNILYTRYDDVFIPLHERAKIARDHKADLFISIHANSSSSKSVRGTEIYILGLHKTDPNLELAVKENASIYYPNLLRRPSQFIPRLYGTCMIGKDKVEYLSKDVLQEGFEAGHFRDTGKVCVYRTMELPIWELKEKNGI